METVSGMRNVLEMVVVVVTHIVNAHLQMVSTFQVM
jgi:hypothetical protein